MHVTSMLLHRPRVPAETSGGGDNGGVGEAVNIQMSPCGVLDGGFPNVACRIQEMVMSPVTILAFPCRF